MGFGVRALIGFFFLKKELWDAKLRNLKFIPSIRNSLDTPGLRQLRILAEWSSTAGNRDGGVAAVTLTLAPW